MAPLKAHRLAVHASRSARRFLHWSYAEAAILGRLKSRFKVHGFRLAQRRTSVSLEDAFWESLRAIATERGTSMQDLIAGINSARHDTVNLSSAIRVWILQKLQAK